MMWLREIYTGECVNFARDCANGANFLQTKFWGKF